LVVEGTATETVFSGGRGEGPLAATSRRMEAGSVIVSSGGDIHQVANREASGTDLVSLHVYSPRLRKSRYFRIDGTEQRMSPHALGLCPRTIVAPL
jgi:cysteine dioxygenase